MTGTITIPPDFKYLDVLLKGMPTHDRFDPFVLRHPRMSTGKRAKIFAPFAALKDFDKEIASKEELYTAKTELSAEDTQELSRRLEILHNLTWNSRMARENRVTVSVTFFVPCLDTHNEAYGVLGQYKTVTGVCRYVDADVGQNLRVDNTLIAFENILTLDSPGELFTKQDTQGEHLRYDGGNENDERI